MKRRNKIVESEIIRPEPITDEVLSVLESIKWYTDDMRERERIQERINNLNVSPLQQRINKIRKIADEAKGRIDRMEDRGPWYDREIGTGFARFGLDIGIQFTRFQKQWERNMHELRNAELKRYDYQERIYPVHPSTNGLHQGGLTILDDDELNI